VSCNLDLLNIIHLNEFSIVLARNYDYTRIKLTVHTINEIKTN
jgi:hypothetical protein